MGRGLLERLEQGVERCIREHVNLVDVINFELAACRGESHGLAEVADLLDTVVRRAVDFQHIERTTFRDLDADVLVGIKIDFGAV